jgi:hypothetical protein
LDAHIRSWLDAVAWRQRDALMARIATAPEYAPELGEWDAGDVTAMPRPRRWLTAGQFCRTFLSGLVAPGATGKTALRILQALALATGKPLAGQRIHRRGRVLIVSFEDDDEELRRRILAARLHHKISAADVKGWLFLACPKGLKLIEMRKSARVIGLLEPALRRAIERRQPDLVILARFFGYALSSFFTAPATGRVANQAITSVISHALVLGASMMPGGKPSVSTMRLSCVQLSTMRAAFKSTKRTNFGRWTTPSSPSPPSPSARWAGSSTRIRAVRAMRAAWSNRARFSGGIRGIRRRLSFVRRLHHLSYAI